MEKVEARRVPLDFAFNQSGIPFTVTAHAYRFQREKNIFLLLEDKINKNICSLYKLLKKHRLYHRYYYTVMTTHSTSPKNLSC